MPILTSTSALGRILVSRTDGLGDVIVTLPIALALKRCLPDTEIAFMVTPYTAPIVRRIRDVDRVLTISDLRKSRYVMKIYKPDAIIFARPEFGLALAALMARIDVRIGTGYRLYSGLFTRWVYDHRRRGVKHEADYGVNLLSPLLDVKLPVEMPELCVSQVGAQEAMQKLREREITGDYMVIHPGSRGSASTWPSDNYARLARTILAENPDLSIIVTAGPGERELARHVVEHTGLEFGRRVAIIDDCSLDALSELLRGGHGFVGSSSGPAHLAALVGTPVVGLYPGLPPLWPARWRPLGKHITTLVPHPDEPLCPDCSQRHEPENCVRRISVARVVNACRGMLVGGDDGTEDYIS